MKGCITIADREVMQGQKDADTAKAKTYKHLGKLFDDTIQRRVIVDMQAATRTQLQLDNAVFPARTDVSFINAIDSSDVDTNYH